MREQNSRPNADSSERRSRSPRMWTVLGVLVCAAMILGSLVWGLSSSLRPTVRGDAGGAHATTTAPESKASGLGAAGSGSAGSGSAGSGSAGTASPGSTTSPDQGDPQETTSTDSGTPSGSNTSTDSSAPSESNTQKASFYVLTAGDVLLHTPVHDSARAASGYDFTPLLKRLNKTVRASALALCHMEVPLVAKDAQISGYPSFAGSAHIATDLVEQGWDGCSTASNHSYDKGVAGVDTTIDALDSAGLGFTGTARSANEAKEIQFYTVHQNGVDINIAHVSVTRALNGLKVAGDKPWLINFVDKDSVIARAKQARKLGADIVIVSSHDGVEYTFEPNAQQQEFAKALAQSGEVDLYVGHHPHVPQPIKKLKGGPDNAGMWTAYSHGNFLSNQDEPCCGKLTSTGVLMFTHIESDAQGKAHVSDVAWRGVTVDRAGRHS